MLGSWQPGREFATSLFTFPFGAVAVRAEPFINTPLIDAPRWSTSSFSDSAHTTPQELSALGEHLDTCKGSHGRLFAVRCAAEMLDGFVSARIVTTLVVAALLIGVSSLVL